eukprot:TRINITY_DN9186_c0_g2_i1.p1 TRINITY_DN9186_c0_g2~~TRINITY_DN9186_c0_g2_i1.p1  ORF type:complete len:1004 (-),score=192.51 TRINITY_DN9186_c0_g2_i1:123-3134(-)
MLSQALIEACCTGNRETVVGLVLNENLSSFLNEPNEQGETAIYCASLRGHTEIVFDLVAIPGIDLCNNKAEHGTCLHAASYGNHEQIVALLLTFGVDSTLKNKDGNTAKQVAQIRGNSVASIFHIWEVNTPHAAIAKLWMMHPILKTACVSSSILFKSLLDKLAIACCAHNETPEAEKKNYIELSRLLAKMWQLFAYEVESGEVVSQDIEELFSTVTEYLRKQKTSGDVIQASKAVYDTLIRNAMNSSFSVNGGSPPSLSTSFKKTGVKQKSGMGSVRMKRDRKKVGSFTNTTFYQPDVPASSPEPSLFFEEKISSTLPTPKMYDIFDVYEKEFASRDHMNFICEQETESGVSIGCAIFSIAEASSQPHEITPYCDLGSMFDVLVTCETGQHSWSFSSLLLLRYKGESLANKIEAFLNSRAAPGTSYYHVTDTSFAAELLKIEQKHPRRHDNLKIGVAYTKNNTDIALLGDAPAPEEDSQYWSFMNAMGDVINTRGWTKYLGDFANDGLDTERDTYYTQWGTVQVMFHVAPWLTAEQYRRLIGNDFLVIIFYENPDKIPFDLEKCKKMGKVPHIFCVVSPAGEDLYHLNFFQKSTIGSFEPLSPPQGLALTGAQVKDLLLTKFYNGVHETFKVAPVSALFTRPRHQTILDLTSQFPKSKQRPKTESAKKKEKKDEKEDHNTSTPELEPGTKLRAVAVDVKALSEFADMLGTGGLGGDLDLVMKPVRREGTESTGSAGSFGSVGSLGSVGSINSCIDSPKLSPRDRSPRLSPRGVVSGSSWLSGSPLSPKGSIKKLPRSPKSGEVTRRNSRGNKEEGHTRERKREMRKSPSAEPSRSPSSERRLSGGESSLRDRSPSYEERGTPRKGSPSPRRISRSPKRISQSPRESYSERIIPEFEASVISPHLDDERKKMVTISPRSEQIPTPVFERPKLELSNRERTTGLQRIPSIPPLELKRGEERSKLCRQPSQDSMRPSFMRIQRTNSNSSNVPNIPGKISNSILDG